ncbi:hypothetical protein AAC387_Pa05g3034 [Persea americana]
MSTIHDSLSLAMAETGVGVGVGSGSSTSYTLQGRVAIVTGASRGIGRTVALHLASLGANLVLNYATSSAQADLLADEINSSPSPSHAVAFQANVSVAAQVTSLFDQAESAFSAQPHILVNCAGFLDPKYPPSPPPPRRTGTTPSPSTSRAPSSAPRRRPTAWSAVEVGGSSASRRPWWGCSSLVTRRTRRRRRLWRR